MALSNEKIEHIRTLHKNGKNDSDIAKIVGVSRNTVRKYKTTERTKMRTRRNQREQIVQRYKNEEEKIVNKWLSKLHQDDRLKQITDKILDLVNDEEVLRRELEDGRGMHQLIGTLKTVVDIAVRVKETNIKQQREDRESIMQDNEVMNDNFEVAIAEWVEKHEDMDVLALIEKDSLDEAVA